MYEYTHLYEITRVYSFSYPKNVKLGCTDRYGKKTSRLKNMASLLLKDVFEMASPQFKIWTRFIEY